MQDMTHGQSPAQSRIFPENLHLDLIPTSAPGTVMMLSRGKDLPMEERGMKKRSLIFPLKRMFDKIIWLASVNE